jgi:hypothetical protein
MVTNGVALVLVQVVLQRFRRWPDPRLCRRRVEKSLAAIARLFIDFRVVSPKPDRPVRCVRAGSVHGDE